MITVPLASLEVEGVCGHWQECAFFQNTEIQISINEDTFQDTSSYDFKITNGPNKVVWSHESVPCPCERHSPLIGSGKSGQ